MHNHDKTTVLVERYRKEATRGVNENSYKGLNIFALPGLHEFIAMKALEHFETNATLLDMAACTGALSLRMQDLGFQVFATDYLREIFCVNSIPFKQADLNHDFSNAYDSGFQAIIASEIIEHLENPRHFARECFKLLEPGGRMVLSTPNVENAVSKALFIQSNYFMWFADKDYEGEGHITPLTQSQIHRIFTEAGFVFRWKGSFGDEAERITTSSVKLRLLTRLVRFFSTLEVQLAREIFVAVLEKPMA